jgi:hypothetical protein
MYSTHIVRDIHDPFAVCVEFGTNVVSTYRSVVEHHFSLEPEQRRVCVDFAGAAVESGRS